MYVTVVMSQIPPLWFLAILYNVSYWIARFWLDVKYNSVIALFETPFNYLALLTRPYFIGCKAFKPSPLGLSIMEFVFNCSQRARTDQQTTTIMFSWRYKSGKIRLLFGRKTRIFVNNFISKTQLGSVLTQLGVYRSNSLAPPRQRV